MQHDSGFSGAAQWSFLHADAVSTRVLTDGSGALTRRWECDPFGSYRVPPSGSGQSDFQFAGEQRDAETGLINLRARYYDPSLGRFLSRDVLRGRPGFPQTFNR